MKTEDEITRYRKANPWVAEWYARNGTIRQMWFRTLRDARAEAERHKDAEVYKESQLKYEPPYASSAFDAAARLSGNNNR